MASGVNNIKDILKLIFEPEYLFAYRKKSKLEKKYKDYHLKIGMYSSLNNTVIGRHVFIGNNAKIYNSKIGDHSYINSNSQLRNVELGKFCSIASNVIFNLGIHPTDFISTHPAFYSNNKGYKTYADKMYVQNEYPFVNAGHDVWVGERAVIIGGVNIGNGSIIAAGAVVTKDVPAYSIVGGVPAKVIRYRFDPETIQLIQESCWWDKDEEWLEKNFSLFLDKSKFSEYFYKNAPKIKA